VYLAIQKWKELLPAAQEVVAQDYARRNAGPPGSATYSAAAAAADDSDDDLVAVEALTLDEAILVSRHPPAVLAGGEGG